MLCTSSSDKIYSTWLHSSPLVVTPFNWHGIVLLGVPPLAEFVLHTAFSCVHTVLRRLNFRQLIVHNI